MDKVLTAAAELNRLLLESAEYKEYKRTRETLSEFPEYKDMADVFRKKQVKHELQKINGEQPEIDELSLANDYADICLINVCNDFFQAEIQFLSLIKSAYSKVCEGIEIEE